MADSQIAGLTSLTLPVGATDLLVIQTALDTRANKIAVSDFLTNAVLVTPTLGVASATTINKVTLTAPATGSTLTIANGKTLTASNTLTFTGTDASSVAFGTGGTVLFSGGALGTPSSGTLTNATGLPEGGLSLTDVTTANASTTAHGFLIKATAPAAGLRNVVAIDNTETAYKNAALFDATVPAALGTAAAGSAMTAARRDHVHDRQTAITAAEMDSANSAKKRTIGCVVDGGGSALTTGIKADIRFPWAGTITKVSMLADQSGSCVIDVWKDTYANYPPTDADSITASAPPTITTATKSEDSTLTGWTTSITAGDTLRFNVDSATTITRVTLILEVTLT